MTDRNKFIKGTLILIFANAIAKILGAVFKIPLTYILKEEGMAIYNTAFSVYIMMLSFVTSGFPFALTKLLAEYTALGKEDRIRPAIRCAAVILCTLGAVASAAMYIFCVPLAYSMREPNAAGAIRAVSASVVLVALGACIKSSNEARSTLLPTAVSQVSEAALKLFAGFYLAVKLADISIFRAAEGAILGVTIGEAFATAFLYITWRISVRHLPKSQMSKHEAGALAAVAVPMLITGCASGLLNMAEISVIRGALTAVRFTSDAACGFLLKYSSYTDAFDNLSHTLQFSPDGVRKLYGAFSGYAQTVFNLPIGIIATISAAATPMLVGAITSKDPNVLKKTTNRVMQLIMVLAVPSSAVCFFFSDELLTLLFSNSFSAIMLSSLAPSLIFLCAANMLLCVLHLAGRIFEPFIAVAAALIAKIILSAILIRIPHVNIIGAGAAGCISSILMLILLLAIFKKSFGITPSFIRLCAPCVAASCVMIGIMLLINPVFALYTTQKPAFILSCICGAAAYALTCALLLKNGDTVMVIKLR